MSPSVATGRGKDEMGEKYNGCTLNYFCIGATFEMRTLYKMCLLNDQDGNAPQG
jgi:hypothetical protein